MFGGDILGVEFEHVAADSSCQPLTYMCMHVFLTALVRPKVHPPFAGFQYISYWVRFLMALVQWCCGFVRILFHV